MREVQIGIGKDQSLTCDFDRFNDDVKFWLMVHGATKVLSNANVNATKESFPDENERRAVARAMSEEKLAALYAGDVRSNATPRTRTTDPLAKELNRLARSHGAALLKSGKLTEATFDAWAANFKKKPAVVALAQANVDLSDEIDDDSDGEADDMAA